jgi:hypothetical protein
MAPRQVRAPREDGAVVAAPPLAEVGDLIEANRRTLAARGPDVLGRPWPDVRTQARRAVLAAAQDYLHAGGEPLPAAGGDSLLMAGHQPELFHPGVWVKNFALNGLARRHGGVPLNLVVDNDAVKSTALHVPVVREPLPPIRTSQPHRTAVAFDRPSPEEPYEERRVQDEALFASLPERVPREWGFRPLLPEFWCEAERQAGRTPLLGERFAAARRALERRWGCHNLEVPVSLVCRTEPFAWFACDLLRDLPRLHATYNACVHDYRRRYGLRSTSHPVPDLATEGDWLEAPFWAWRAGRGRRGRLMARQAGDTVELRVGGEPWPALPRRPEAMAAAWGDLERHGFKVRSRALTNTLYARLFLCDLFIHGIGGGKYDEVTDALLHRYYGVEPAGYLVLSATLLLPLSHYPARPDDCDGLRRQVRDLFYNPQRHLDGAALSDPAAAALVRRKDALITQRPTDARGRRERFQRLRAVTEALRDRVADRIRGRRDEWADCDRQVRANEVLRRRDYAFCLYPEEALRPFCAQFLAAGSAAPATH